MFATIHWDHRPRDPPSRVTDQECREVADVGDVIRPG